MTDDPRFKVGFYRSKVGYHRGKAAQLNKAPSSSKSKHGEKAGKADSPKDKVRVNKPQVPPKAGANQGVADEEAWNSADMSLRPDKLSAEDEARLMAEEEELFGTGASGNEERLRDKKALRAEAEGEAGDDDDPDKKRQGNSKAHVNKGKEGQQSQLKDGFEAKYKPLKGKLSQLSKEQAAEALKKMPAAEKLKALGAPLGTRDANRPPDAFALLHAAQPAGVYFKEDGRSAGGVVDGEDARLEAAVRETRRLLNDVAGIERVSAGRNAEDERVIVVVTRPGFGEAQLDLVPPDVQGFSTLMAIPYELLPLRRVREGASAS